MDQHNTRQQQQQYGDGPGHRPMMGGMVMPQNQMMMMPQNQMMMMPQNQMMMMPGMMMGSQPTWVRPPPPPPPRRKTGGNEGSRKSDILDMTYDEYILRYDT